jgi:hypothetical protein
VKAPVKRKQPKIRRVRRCRECLKRDIAIIARDYRHKEQQEIALGAILALLAESGDAEKLRASVEGWKCRCLSHVQRMADLQRQCGESDKALESYVASFDAHRTQTDAMLNMLCRALEGAERLYIRDEQLIAYRNGIRLELREIMDCARRDIGGTIYFRGEDARRLEEVAR